MGSIQPLNLDHVLRLVILYGDIVYGDRLGTYLVREPFAPGLAL
jgi:hypothetical protein